MASTPVVAQSDPLRWGEIPDDHIAMDHVPTDPDAGAVVLGNFGNLRIGDDLSMEWDRHQRIKLFSEAAYDMATVEIVYLRGIQQLQRLEGQTFVPDGSGSFRRVELRPSDVFEERDGDLTRATFTLPALEPGAIVEFRYRIRSRTALGAVIPDWLFQTGEPTLWSEYRARFPGFITINFHPIGPHPDFHVEEIDERPFEPPTRQAGRGYHGGRSHDTIQTTTFRWVMKDVPALREEEHVSSIWNHAFGLRFQWAGYYQFDRRRMVEYREWSETWDNVSERLLNNDHFGRRLRAPRAVRDEVANLIANVDSDAEKVQRIYDFVRQSIVWSKTYRLYADRSLDRVLESRSGTSGEINLLLIAMLREAGLSADPVAVSTRGNGEVVQWFTSARQFNHVIAQTQVGSQRQLLDATDRHRPAGMLPVEVLNDRGRLISADRSAWVRLEPVVSSRTVEVDAYVMADGTISGVISARLQGYPALDLRHRLADLEQNNQAVRLDDRGRAIVEVDGFTFSEVTVEGLEGDGEVSFDLHFETGQAAQALEHLLTFDGVLVTRADQSPFQQPQRSYPVEFAFPFADTYVARFNLPAGFEIDDVPAQVRLATPGNGLTYARLITPIGQDLQVRRIYGRRQLVFEPREYAALREVYDGITASDAASIVLAGAPELPTVVDQEDGE